MYESNVYRCNPVHKHVLILDSFFPPPPLAYSYGVVFSLNIQIDQQSKQVFCELFCKDKVSMPLVFVFVCASKLSRI